MPDFLLRVCPAKGSMLLALVLAKRPRNLVLPMQHKGIELRTVLTAKLTSLFRQAGYPVGYAYFGLRVTERLTDDGDQRRIVTWRHNVVFHQLSLFVPSNRPDGLTSLRLGRKNSSFGSLDIARINR